MGFLEHSLVFMLIGACANAIHGQKISVILSNDEPISIGDDLTVHCRIEDFQPGAAAVWWKRQGPEEVRLGVNNGLDVQVDRYSLEVQQTARTMLFYLNIRGIEAEDNGEFGCSLLSDEDNKFYANVIVSDPVQSVRLFAMGSADTSGEPTKEFESEEEFFFHDGEDYFFRCIVSGSNPIPTVDVTVGYRNSIDNLNDKFERQDNLISDPSSGEYGFRKTTYETVLTTTEPIVVGWKANSQEFKCSGSVPNMETPKSIFIRPIMKIPPIIECREVKKVPIYTPNVQVACQVYSDPPLQEIRWYWGDSVKAISLVPGEKYGTYEFNLEDGNKPDMKIAKLTIDRTFVEMYRKYNLVAKNTKGIAFHSFTLKRDPKREKFN